MKRIIGCFLLLTVGTLIVSCGSGTDTLIIGDSGVLDGQSDTAPGSGGYPGTGGTGGSTAGTGGGTPSGCEEGKGNCVNGVYRKCVNGIWEQDENCSNIDKYCNETAGCVDTCDNDNQCKNYEDNVNGEFCRKDGRCSPKLFVTVWNTPKDNVTVVLPYFHEETKSSCNFKILWGDEQENTDITTLASITDCKDLTNRTHTYANKGKYTIKILGTYDGWGSDNTIADGSDALKHLVKIVSFGPVGLTQYAFTQVSNIDLPEKDIPDASKWTNAKGLFYNSSKFDQNIEKWDVSKVTNMAEMFKKAKVYNKPLANWNVSSVKDMSSMFQEAEKFDQDINEWDVSNVENMSSMFQKAKNFNQDINEWNVQHVQTMKQMFWHASVFNQPLETWNVSNVKSMERMFTDALKFNQDLSAWTLNKDVMLENIFMNTDITKENYCKVKVLPIWKNQELGPNFDCSND